MTGKVRVSKSLIEGFGVFACYDLFAHDVVLTIDDSYEVDSHGPVREEQATYFDYLAEGKVVWMQPPESYINHSCNPNVYVRTRRGIREVIAIRAIQAGEEIAYDYSINGSGDTVWNCSCGANRCRRLVHSDFFRLPLELQREYLPLLDDWFREESLTNLKP